MSFFQIKGLIDNSTSSDCFLHISSLFLNSFRSLSLFCHNSFIFVSWLQLPASSLLPPQVFHKITAFPVKTKLHSSPFPSLVPLIRQFNLFFSFLSREEIKNLMFTSRPEWSTFTHQTQEDPFFFFALFPSRPKYPFLSLFPPRLIFRFHLAHTRFFALLSATVSQAGVSVCHKENKVGQWKEEKKITLNETKEERSERKMENKSRRG